jgi:hypothetical protein
LSGGSSARVFVCGSLKDHNTVGTIVSTVACRVFEWKSTGGRRKDGSGAQRGRERGGYTLVAM